MATNYGITPEGFNRMRLPEIIKKTFDEIDSGYGKAVNRTETSIIGNLVNCISSRIDELWQLGEDTYYSMYPATAGEGSIDNALSFANVQKIGAQKTHLYCVCYGINGTTLPNSTQIKANDGTLYDIAAASKISYSNCITLSIKLLSVTSGTVYTLSIGSTYISVTAGNSDTVSTIYAAIISGLPASWSGTIIDNILKLTQTTDRINGKEVSPSSTLNVVEIGSPIKFYCDNYGDIESEIGSITSINTTVYGWNSVNNESACYAGRLKETTDEVRRRYASAVFSKSKTMLESIKVAVNNVDGVTYVSVQENDTNETVNGMKPHSVEVIVLGGDNEEIAKAISESKTAGIDTNGTESGAVVDSSGVSHTLYFNRPEQVRIYVRVTVTQYDEEELSSDYASVIQKKVVETGSAFGAGKDVIYQRFVGPIYSNTNGIGGLKVELSTDGITYSEANIAISLRQISAFTASDVTVVMTNS